MKIELDENGYTLDGKFKLVPVLNETNENRTQVRIGDIKIDGDITEEFEKAGKEIDI